MQQQPLLLLPIYFEVEFDLNDNFFVCVAVQKESIALVGAQIPFMHRMRLHILRFSLGLHWIHHFSLISNNRQPSNLL